MSEYQHGDTATSREKSAYALLFTNCLLAAHAEGASDIHIEPTRRGIDIRFRVFGDMTAPWRQLSQDHKQGFLNAAKKATGLSISTSGKAQDSRCSISGIPADFRVNLLPTLFGEKIVLRLLDSGREFGLDGMGIQALALNAIKNALDYHNGVVLMSGPTGSGKTTTLYSMLCSLDRQKKNIVTLEDPIEYTIDGINQVKIDGKVSFANALRAVLRQDPDVILIGEIRDEETADLVFKAAATGHLVLSTIHANGALEVIGRLLGLGVKNDAITENLRFSAAQRLIGNLCQNCSITPSPEQISAVTALGIGKCDARDQQFRLRNGSGCEKCRAGIVGRLPVIEYADGATIRRFVQGGWPKLSAEFPANTLQSVIYEFAESGTVDLMEVMKIG